LVGRVIQQVLVRCIASEVGVAHVRRFVAAVETVGAGKGQIIASRRVSQPARQDAADLNTIEVLTFDELIDATAQFGSYFAWLEHEVMSRGIHREYVDLACTKEEIDPDTGYRLGISRYDERNGWIDGYVDRWLDDPAKEHLSILGEFGTGKTWFSLHYAYHALQKYRGAKAAGTERPRIPIVIFLRDYARAVSVESLFSEFFFRQHEIGLPSYRAFEQLNRMGRLLLIFDGFDEMAQKVDYQKVIDNFWELARVVVPGSKVILTCRSEHFRYAQEGRDVLSGRIRASTGNIVLQAPRFEVLELAPLTDAQVRAILGHKADQATVERVLAEPQLLDLARRPVLIEFILEALPDLTPDTPLDMAHVYLHAVRRKMERDIKQERTFTSLADKLYFLCELSFEMLYNDRMKLHYREFPERIRTYFGPKVAAEELDHWWYDLMGQTILIRDADGNYEPAHRSLLEFFVAYKFAAELGILHPAFTDLARRQSQGEMEQLSQYYRWTEYFRASGKVPAPLLGFEPEVIDHLSSTVGARPLTKAIRELMSGMIGRDHCDILAPLLAVVRMTKGQTVDTVGFAGGNAISILNDKGILIKDQDLSNTVLRAADLKKARLYGSDLSGCDLHGAEIRHTEAKGSKFDNISIDSHLTLVHLGNRVELMPKGSTVLDMAFRLHSELGYHCIGAEVNGKRRDVQDEVYHGDSVWVLIDRSQITLQPDWWQFVQTSTAHRLITQYERSLVNQGHRQLWHELEVRNGLSHIVGGLRE